MNARLSTHLRNLAFLACSRSFASPATSAQGWQHLGDVKKTDKLPDGVELSAGPAKVRVTAISDGIFRVRVAPNGTFPKDFSWAVIARPNPPPVEIADGQSEVRITAGTAIAIVHKSPLLIDFADAQGNLLLADEPTLPMAWDGERIQIWKKMPSDEGYFGLGD